ncbi:MAG: arginine--tRNA ligase [Bacilli bacterium]|nr:arginine--tRNA ligase [Bacilli bacterium]MBR3049262.1 arginine--tRNA ligase [Bacilli bacterium]
MSIIKELTEDIKKIVKKAGYEVENLVLETSNRPDLGQYQINDAMNLARTYHKNPREIAEDIVKELEKDNRFTNLNIAGPGFINITLTNDYLIDCLNKLTTSLDDIIDKKEKKKVIIDYGGANVSKALHVGHLRSANIGEALKRLAKTLGYEVLGDAHLGDFGRPLGMVIKEIQELHPGLPYFDPNYTGDYSEIVLPITNEDLEKIYPIASQKAKNDEEYLNEVRQITNKFQNKEKGYYELWKKIVEISKSDIKKTYDNINTDFEIWNGESDEAEYLKETKEIFEKKELLKESDGAKIVEVKKEEDNAPMPPLMFLNSNHTYTYATTDLATILDRKKNYNPDEIWYVTDDRQSLHFEQVFRAARLANLVDEKVNLEHIPYGTMNGKDGKPFKTRDGGVMSLKELIKLVNEETIKKINNDTMSEEEKKDISKTVAIAAIKYADLVPFRTTDYIFEIDKFSEIEGKTGPYLLYSTIRMKSLLEKSKDLPKNKITKFKTNTETDITLQILNLPLVLDKSLELKSLNEITEYLFKLTSLYNKFYSENKILTEEDSELQESWLALTSIVYSINNLLLDILSIKVPEKM